MSLASIAGSSMAAKCPPFGISVHRVTLYPRSTYVLGGIGISRGKCAMATGTLTFSPGANLSGRLRPSQYNRMADGIERVNQYSETVVRISSRLNTRSTSPPQSLQERNLSTIQAARPTGESFSDGASTSGFVD